MKNENNEQHGGRRVGAGRPPGRRNKATVDRENLLRLTAVQLQAAGASNHGTEFTAAEIGAMRPVEILMAAATIFACKGDWLTAGDLAAKAAPYLHARLQHVVADTTVRRIEDMTDDELAALADRLGSEENDEDGEQDV